MDITNWNNDEIMRLVMAKGHITQKMLLESLKENSGEDIPQSTFSCKIRRNSLKLAELQSICKVLGYAISIEPISNKVFRWAYRPVSGLYCFGLPPHPSPLPKREGKDVGHKIFIWNVIMRSKAT